jgi:hypothetical protein
MSGLREQLSSLATHFADSVLAVIRGASIDDLLSESHAAPRRAGRPRGRSTPSTSKSARVAAPRAKAGRLARRSPADIARALATVVALVKRHPKGLRSEQIRAELKMRPNEMPRILGEGLAKKALKSKGQKRATTYSAA